MGEDRSVPDPDARLGEILIREGFVRPADVEDCLSTLSSLRASGSATPPTLGELLVKKGCLTPEQWEATVRFSRREDMKAGATPATAPGVPPIPLPAPDSGFERRYGVTGEIGRGGMGLILDAKDLRIHRELAIKVHLRGDDVDPGEFAKFLQEAQVQGQLEHPNICPVHELGTDAHGRPYFTMKKVKGRSLAEVLELLQREPAGGEAGAFTLSRLLDIFCKICDAVAFAHSKGVIHRDLKPQNIMIGEFGEVLVMDWGLAKILGTKDTRRVVADRLEEGAQASMDGDVMGTPTYMPPEQAQGRVGEIDARSDVYALGGILYAMLTLQAPLQGSSRAEVMERARHAEVVPPSQRAPGRGIPADLEAAAMKALRYRREDRYGDVPAFKADIAAFLEGRTLAAAAYTPLQILSKWVRRNRVFALTASAAAVLLLIATAVYVRGVTRERSVAQREAERARAAEGDARDQSDVAQRERAKAEEAARKATAESVRAQGAELQARRHSGMAEAARLESERRLAESLVSQGDALILDKRFRQARSCYRQARELLTQVGAPTQAADLGLMDVALQTHPPLMTLPLKNTHVYFLAILPGDQGLRGEHGQVVLWDLRTGRDLKVIKTATFSDGAVSPDSRRVLLGGNKEIAVWDLASGAKVRSFPAHAGWVTELAPSPDGGKVLSYAKEDGLKVWNLENGTELPGALQWTRKNWKGEIEDRFKKEPVQSLAWSPDGERVAWGTKTQLTVLWDLKKNGPVGEATGHTNYVNSVAFSPDGRRLLSASGDNTIRIWDALTGEGVRILRGHTNYVESALWAQGGRQVLSASSDHTIRLWDGETGEEIRRFTDHEQTVGNLAVFPDGRFAVSSDTDAVIKVWDLGAECRDRSFRVHFPHAGALHRATFSSDGRRLVSWGDDRVIRLWDTETGAALESHPMPTRYVWAVDASADGSKLVVGGSGGVQLCSLDRRLEVQTLDGSGNGTHHVALSRDGRHALSAGESPAIHLWELATSRSLRMFPFEGGAFDIRFFPDGSRVVAAGKGGVRAWSAPSGEVLWSDASCAVTALAFSPDGRRIACGAAGQVRLLDAESGSTAGIYAHSRNVVTALSFSEDGTKLFAVTDASILQWDVPSRRLVRTRQTQAFGIALSPRSPIYSAPGSDERLRIHHVETDQVLQNLVTHTEHISALSPPRDLSITGDGSLALSCGGRTGVTLWDVRTGKVLRTWEDWANTAALSLDGTRLVTSGGRGVEVWNLEDAQRPPRLLRPDGNRLHLALTRDGRRALFVFQDDALQYWDLEEGRKLRDVGRHSATVNAIALDPDGRVAASGDEDGKLKVWDLETGAVIDLKGHDGWISSAAFLPGATRLLSGSGDRSLRLWDARKGHEIRGYPEHLESVTSIGVSTHGRTAVLGTRSNVVRIWDLASWRELRSFGDHTGYINKVAVSADGSVALSASDDRSIRCWDFAIARRLQDFEDRVASAVSALRSKPDDPGSFAALGEWYAYRGIVSWAIDLLEKARKGGAAVPALTLARCHWEMGAVDAARRHFQEALDRREAPEPYLKLCLQSLDPPKTPRPEPPPAPTAPAPAPPPNPAPGSPYLGIQADTARDPEVEGAPLAGVLPGKPAEAAGLRAGDVITHFAGKEIHGFEDLRKAIQASKVGDRVEIRYLRDGVAASVPCEVGRFAPETPPK